MASPKDDVLAHQVVRIFVHIHAICHPSGTRDLKRDLLLKLSENLCLKALDDPLDSGVIVVLAANPLNVCVKVARNIFRNELVSIPVAARRLDERIVEMRDRLVHPIHFAAFDGMCVPCAHECCLVLGKTKQESRNNKARIQTKQKTGKQKQESKKTNKVSKRVCSFNQVNN